MTGLIKKFHLDALVIFALASAAFLACVFEHEAMKPVTRTVGYVGPIVFATVTVLLIPVLGLANRHAWARRARRLLLDVGVGSVVIFAAMFRAETFYAPIAYWQGATPAEVVAKIASNDDVARFEAWSRIVTLGTEERQLIAQELGTLLTGTDDDARNSAVLTLEMPLRRHTMTALLTIKPELQDYVERHAKGEALPDRVEQAGSFASGFVTRNFRSILKALGPKHRDKLPEGGMDALFLALATEEPIGHLILKGFAAEGDETLKPRAETTMRLAAIRR